MKKLIAYSLIISFFSVMTPQLSFAGGKEGLTPKEMMLPGGLMLLWIFLRYRGKRTDRSISRTKEEIRELKEKFNSLTEEEIAEAKRTIERYKGAITSLEDWSDLLYILRAVTFGTVVITTGTNFGKFNPTVSI